MKKFFDEGFYSGIHRVRTHGANKPLRSLDEMAEEFGVSKMSLSGRLHRLNGPKEVIRAGSTSRGGIRWFDPDAVRKWWKEINKESA